ncbi:unnamed protein product, partial [Linum tenue]
QALLKLQSPLANSAPTRLHQRSFSTRRPRAIYRGFKYSGTYFVKWFTHVFCPSLEPI